MKVPKVSIVVCCYNAEKHLSKCLDALKVQTYPNFEIVLVDDGSRDKTSKIAKEYDVKLIRIDHSGLPVARNVGVKSAEGDIIAFTDADCVVEPRWLEKLIKELTAGDFAGVMGGIRRVLNSESFVARCLGISTGSEPIKCYAGGYNIAYWKKIIEKMGGFDSAFMRGGDYDFYLRVSKNHRVAWAKDATVFFRYSESIEEYVRKSIRDGMWLREILRKHPWQLKNVLFENLESLAALVFPPLLLMYSLGRVFKHGGGFKHGVGSFLYIYLGLLAFNVGFYLLGTRFKKLQSIV